MKLVPGMMVSPNVRLARELGQGGMGSVWLAEHTALGISVAVKFISEELLQRDSTTLARFKREARSAAQIKSPHVVQVHDLGVLDDGTPFIVMEALEGETLGDRLAVTPRLPMAELLEIVAQVGKGLEHAHSRGVIHRDIKPPNVFLSRSHDELIVKILDFGIARQQALPRHSAATGTGALLGTPEYMSPEQILSAKDVEAGADLWALAVMAYEMLVGCMPFQGETLGALILAITMGNYTAPSQCDPSLGPSIDEWFRRALARDPRGRFQSARELVDAARAVFVGQVAPVTFAQPPVFVAHGAPVSGSRSDGPASARSAFEPPPPSGRASHRGATDGARPPDWAVPDDADAALEEGTAPMPMIHAATIAGGPASMRHASPAGAHVSPTGPTFSGAASTFAGEKAGGSRARPVLVLGAGLGTAALIAGALYFTRDRADRAAQTGAGATGTTAASGSTVVASAGATSLGPPGSTTHDMVQIAPGEHPMGCGDDAKCFPDERPLHRVKLGGFSIMRHEVTADQYDSCVVDGKCKEPGQGNACTWRAKGKGRLPINCVDWEGAKAYCAAQGMSLPTEAQWEAAARGSVDGHFPWGSATITCDHAVIDNGCGTGGPLPVGSRPRDASRVGALDMAGNVREWTASGYAAYPGGAIDNGVSGRVNRGASWVMKPDKANTIHTRVVDDLTVLIPS
jgi:serine/threonine-protein kinase